MFQSRPVRISFVCNDCAFGCFEDLTSKDGHRLIHKDSYRHYVVYRSPRILFKGYNFDSRAVRIKVQRSVDVFEEFEVPVDTTVISNGTTATIERIEETEHPEIQVSLSNGDRPKCATAFELLVHIAQDQSRLLQLEVMYVGQTMPSQAYLRLVGHETISTIANRCLIGAPQWQLFIKLLRFEEPKYEYADSEEEPPADWCHGAARSVGQLSTDLQTSIVEAALVRACQPEFNTHYKKHFPSKTHSTYNAIFDHCIDEVEVLITENLRRYSWRLQQNAGNVLLIRAPIAGKRPENRFTATVLTIDQ